MDEQQETNREAHIVLRDMLIELMNRAIVNEEHHTLHNDRGLKDHLHAARFDGESRAYSNVVSLIDALFEFTDENGSGERTMTY